ncbi:serine-rich coiled-coil domain-containing protein 2 [Chanos chanos]|uniref:Serine-rich coiled-coil domain-containing protein 2 n=1 Tax=Chanos chanos TaxID=29144 RepID=A0A6J2VE72_CHACN|nr:serine-rich coiled-coil domain-containing protein 2-like [Chanos chanos]
MEHKALKQPTMVSRLPKFGSRPPGATSAWPTASVVPVCSTGGKGVTKGSQSGFTQMPPSLSMKWKKGKVDCKEEEDRTGSRSVQQPQSPVPLREIKKPSTPSGKVRRSGPVVSTTSPRTIPNFNRGSTYSAASKPGQCLYNGRSSMNGVGGGAGHSNSSGPGLSPDSSQRGRLSSLSQSSDSLKSLSQENIVRSNSFTHFKRLPSPTNQPITRSLSFNRATDVAKEMPRPLAKSPLARSPNGMAGPNITGVGKSMIAKPTMSSGTGCPLPPTMMKSLLPSCPGNKSPALSYKLTRPTFMKRPQPLQVRKVLADSESAREGKESNETPSPTSDLNSNAEITGITPEEPSESKETEPSLDPAMEVAEDMSLSSTSSLERNDTSEEYMDDFDNLGNGSGMLLLHNHEGEIAESDSQAHDNAPVNQYCDVSPVTDSHSFLTDDVDWGDIVLTGSKEELEISPCHLNQSLPTGGEFPNGSSLDLSPSDSSGGIYMWDEEGLEHLGSSRQLCGSYNSDLNSMDVLNNLESCDLEEDDLMLDVDLPEDASLHSDADGISHLDHSGRADWPMQWRRRQQGAVCEPFDGCQDQGVGYLGSGQLPVDELILKHMVEDCFSVKEQLLQLKRLLEMEEESHVEDTMVSEICSQQSTVEQSCDQQVEDLLKEVQELREELRRKDNMISELTQQMSTPLETTRCHCLQREEESQEERHTLHDKSTQTPWRSQAPQILQPSSFLHNEHQFQQRRANPHTEDPSGRVNAGTSDRLLKVQSCPAPPPGPAAMCPSSSASSAAAAVVPSSPLCSGPNELRLFLGTHLKITDPDRLEPSQTSRQRSEKKSQKKLALHTFQPPSLNKRTSALIKPQESPAGPAKTRHGAQSRTGLRVDSASPSRAKKLHSPSRGLLSFSSAPQAVAPASATAPSHSAQDRSQRQTSAHREAVARPRGLLAPNHSRLPKPKSH